MSTSTALPRDAESILRPSRGRLLVFTLPRTAERAADIAWLHHKFIEKVRLHPGEMDRFGLHRAYIITDCNRAGEMPPFHRLGPYTVFGTAAPRLTPLVARCKVSTLTYEHRK